jgi:isoaspartyl peptidase/L-asparaginase-like protein (Ntn-hydrolase superfamily)
VGLFGNKQEKAARHAEAEAEVARLTALSAVELAIELMAAFSAGKRGRSPELGELQVAMWTMANHNGSAGNVAALRDAVREALQVLENANLLTRVPARGGGWFKLSAAGEQALASDTVRQTLAGAG